MTDEEEREFQRLWGPWAVPTPAEAASLLDGFTRPWWISGGWAIEAFTGVERPRKDVDVTHFRRDVSCLREHFRGRYDLWAAGSGTLRPLDDRRPRPPSWSEQVWVREHALAPWILDVQLNPGSVRRWIFKRERTVIGTLDDATWIGSDGLRYLRPELVLAHKARHARTLDDADLSAALPLLDASARAWLRDYVMRENPTHRWRRILDAPRRRASGPADRATNALRSLDPSASRRSGQASGSGAAGPGPRGASTRRSRG